MQHYSVEDVVDAPAWRLRMMAEEFKLVLPMGANKQTMIAAICKELGYAQPTAPATPAKRVSDSVLRFVDVTAEYSVLCFRDEVAATAERSGRMRVNKVRWVDGTYWYVLATSADKALATLVRGFGGDVE